MAANRNISLQVRKFSEVMIQFWRHSGTEELLHGRLIRQCRRGTMVDDRRQALGLVARVHGAGIVTGWGSVGAATGAGGRHSLAGAAVAP
jgi:hypothetical protein